jgi:uncharacterized protein
VGLYWAVNFEWDPRKDAAKERKHGITFDEASSVFGDPFALTADDPDHSLDERRFLTVGYSTQHRLIIVAHTDRTDCIRIINAREVTPAERERYEEGEQ